jgi:hypothetical protein
MKKLIKEYLAYIKDNPKGYWFKRKLYGWGWTPATKEGWTIIGGYLLLVVGLVYGYEKNIGIHVKPIEFLGLLVASVVCLVLVAWHTGESPKWQWGKHEERDD